MSAPAGASDKRGRSESRVELLDDVALDDDDDDGGGGGGGGAAVAVAPLSVAVGRDDEGARIDSVEQRAHVPKSRIVPASFNVINSIIGAGTFAVPFALLEAGFLLGCALLLLSAGLTLFSMRLMIATGHAANVTTYPLLCRRAFGDHGFRAVTFFMWSFAFGAMITYSVMIAETLPVAFAALLGPDVSLARRVPALLLVAFLVFLPLSFVRNISNLAKFSGVAMCGAFYCVLAVAFDSPAFDAEHDDGIDRTITVASRNFFPAIGLLAGAFVCHHNVFVVYSSLKDRTPAAWNKVAALAIGVSTFVLAFTAIAGYLAYGQQLKGNVLRNLPDDVASNIGRFCAALLLALTYPIENLVARECLEELLAGSSAKLRAWLAADNGVPGAGLSCSKPTHDQRIYIALTLAHVTLATLIAVVAPQSGIVFELVGGFSAVCLAYIVPAACSLKLNPERRLAWNRAPEWFLLVFGVLSMIASTGFTLVNLATGETRGD